MHENKTKIEKACAFLYDGHVIQPEHMEALLNLDRITDTEMLQELLNDCLTIASEENLEGVIDRSFFKHMRWIINYLSDLKRQPIKHNPELQEGIGRIIKPRTEADIQRELDEFKQNRHE